MGFVNVGYIVEWRKWGNFHGCPKFWWVKLHHPLWQVILFVFHVVGCLGWGSLFHIFLHRLTPIAADPPPNAPQVCHCCFHAAAACRQIQRALTQNFAARHQSKPAGGSGTRHDVGEILALKLHFNFWAFTLKNTLRNDKFFFDDDEPPRTMVTHSGFHKVPIQVWRNWFDRSRKIEQE